MKNRIMLYVCALLVAIPGIGGEVLGCPSAPYITNPDDGDAVFYGAKITATCTGGTPPLTWSGDGSFYPTTGDSVTWTAPLSGSSATITVTDALDRTDSVTVNLTNIIYVDADAAANGDGTSWAKAFRYLRDGLDAASAGLEIWVAEGIYYPDDGEGHPGGSRYDRFDMRANVAVYGGFAGTETLRSSRAPASHPTILSGDIDGGGTHAGNSYHVVRFSGDSGAVLDGFTVTKGYADNNSDGAGITIYYCSPTIANCIIEDNRGSGDDSDGGGMHCYGASPTVTNCDFLDNVAGDDGGGLCNKSGSSGTFTNCTFSGNSTLGDNGNSHGGGIYNTAGEGGGSGSSPTFNNCSISGNSTVHDGGGVANADSGTNPSFDNCTISGNSSGDSGGGIANKNGADASFTSCTISSNSCSKDGGGAHITNGCNGSFSGCDFQSNHAGDDGGGACVELGNPNSDDTGSSPSFTNCTFTSNTAVEDGGGANNKGTDTDPSYSGCTFTNNAASDDGGAMAWKDGSAGTIGSCVFNGNTATNNGGAVFCSRGDNDTPPHIDQPPLPSFSSCTFKSNTAGQDGGAVHCKQDGTDPTFESCDFVREAGQSWANQADRGGAVFCEEQSGPSFSSCLFEYNRAASTDGGAVYCRDNGTTPALSSCEFYHNRASDDGGALCFNDSADGSVTSCTIEYNTAVADGGGIQINNLGTNPTISGCTIRYNVAGDDGGGIRINNDAQPTLQNNTVTNNTPNDIEVD